MAKTNFVDANPSQGILGTLVTALFLNKLGLHRHDGLDDDGHGPLDYAVAGGTANALTVALNPPLTALVPGMPIYVKAASANTGAVTLNVDGLETKSITKAGGNALDAGDIIAGQIIEVAYDGTSFQLLSAYSLLDYAASTGSANAYVLTLSPALPAYTDGKRLSFKAHATNTGACTLNVNNLGAVAIRGWGDQALRGGEILAGQIVEVVYNGAKWHLTSNATPATVVGAYRNLNASASGTNATANVSADELVLADVANNYITLRNISLTINDAVMGANGLDAGTLASSTWYAVHVIYNPTTDTVAGLLSLSATAPTMPSGYTFKARVGWVRTDATANKWPIAFQQMGRRVMYRCTAPAMASGVAGTTALTATTWVSIGTSNYIPPTAAAITVALYYGGGSDGGAQCAPINTYQGYHNGALTPPMSIGWAVTNDTKSQVGEFVVNGNAQSLFFASNTSFATLSCMGWEDNL